jgi:two-component system sensor histidine kinase PilS (NtrC family)
LYIFLILEGGYINFRRGAIIATSLSVIFFGTLIELEFYKKIPYLTLIRDESPINNRLQLLSLLGYNFIGFFAAGSLWGILSEQFKRAHKSLKSLEDLTKIVFKKIPSGIMTVNSDKLITSFNSAAETITGLKFEDILGMPLNKVFPNFRIDNPLSSRNECTFKNKEGRELLLGYSVGDLGSAGSVIIFQDLTREKQMEEDVKRSERLAALGRLSAGLAHEMRTIVSSISASVQLLKSVESDKKEHEKLTQIISNESKRLNEIVTNFLNFSKPERDMSELFNIDQIIRDTVETFEKNNSKNTKFIIDVATKKTKIKGNREGMRQVFSNLLLNAIESNAEKVIIKVLDSQVQPQMLEVSVSDNGCGISQEVLPHIFEPFFTTKGNGAGLGLATVYRIIDAHKGKINVESVVNNGTSFKILLPKVEVN